MEEDCCTVVRFSRISVPISVWVIIFLIILETPHIYTEKRNPYTDHSTYSKESKVVWGPFS